MVSDQQFVKRRFFREHEWATSISGSDPLVSIENCPSDQIRYLESRSYLTDGQTNKIIHSQLQVNSGVLAGILTIQPEKIQAVDMDTIDARIRYTIDSGAPDSWATYFAIDPNDGAVRQLVPVDTNNAKKFQLVIKVSDRLIELRTIATAATDFKTAPFKNH